MRQHIPTHRTTRGHRVERELRGLGLRVRVVMQTECTGFCDICGEAKWEDVDHECAAAWLNARLPGFDERAVPPPPEGWTSDKWSTPPEMVRELESEFGAFDLDPCCEEHTAKAPTFYTRDGVEQPWFGNVWLNPPYSNPTPWLMRARHATETGEAELVVALLPGATDTAWFHEQVLPFAELRFIRGRVRFYGWMGTPIGGPRWPSLLAIYRRRA